MLGLFENLSLKLKEKNNPDEAEVHVFTGENGTGKSTILYLLTAFPNQHLILPRIQKKISQILKLKPGTPTLPLMTMKKHSILSQLLQNIKMDKLYMTDIKQQLYTITGTI